MNESIRSIFQSYRHRVHGPWAMVLALTIMTLPINPIHAQPVLDGGLGRGINFGNMLEAPAEGAWGLTVEPDFFARVKEAGFDHIRLPVSWTHHTDLDPPYLVDESFFERVDEVLAMAEMIDVQVILNNHHHDELDEDPVAESPRFLAIWEQIATRYADKNDWLHFEVLNEPDGAFSATPELWNDLLSETLAVIRESNPTRKVFIGPVGYNSIYRLDDLTVPDDPNLVASVHYYDPFPFTHQGATWVGEIPPVGVLYRPLEKAIAPPWQNYSWDTTVDNTGPGLRVTYREGWSALSLYRDTALQNVEAIQFRVNRPYQLQLVVFDENGERTDFPVQSSATPGNEKMYTVSLDSLPADFEFRHFAIQNFNPDAQIPMIISVLRIKQNGKWDYLMTTQRNIIRRAFQTARDWAGSNSLPLHLGEFGAYDLGDMQSRVRWTQDIRVIAEQKRMAWSYWELAAGFGTYDPVNQQWRNDLRRAVIPPPRR
jgi:hypothetical protein